MPVRDSVISVSLKDKATAAMKNMRAASDNLIKSLGGVEGALKTIGEIYVLKQIQTKIYGMYKSYAEEETTITRLNLIMSESFKGLDTEIQKTADSLQNLYTPGQLRDFSLVMKNNKVSADFLTQSIGLLSKASAVYGVNLNELGAKISLYTGKGVVGKKGFGIELLNKPEYTQQMKQLAGLTDKTSILAREKLILNILTKESINLERQWNTVSKTGGILVQQLANSWGELTQAIGGVFSPFLDFILPYLIQVIRFITHLIDITPKWAKFLIGSILLLSLLAGAFVILTGAVGIFSKALLALLANPIVLAIVAIGAAIVAVGLIIEDLYYWINGGDSIIGDHLGAWDSWIKKAVTLEYWLGVIKDNYTDLLNFLSNPAVYIGTTLAKKAYLEFTGEQAQNYVYASTPQGMREVTKFAQSVVVNLTANVNADDKGKGQEIAAKIASETKSAIEEVIRNANEAAAKQRVR
jgi:hypothetical protein